MKDFIKATRIFFTWIANTICQYRVEQKLRCELRGDYFQKDIVIKDGVPMQNETEHMKQVNGYWIYK